MPSNPTAAPTIQYLFRAINAERDVIRSTDKCSGGSAAYGTATGYRLRLEYVIATPPGTGVSATGYGLAS